jgi:hypothetical protein
MRRILFSSILTFLLAGCATTSFAPPIVKMDKELTFTRSQTTFNAVCTPNPNDPTAQQIRRDTDGALLLVNNFILTYRCQADRAAEGRQYFEVPGFLSTIGGVAAAAFGAPADVAIGTGAASAALNQGKSYYAPRDKAVVLNDGLDALLCIQNEAVGIDPYTLKTLSAAQEATGSGSTTTEPQPVVAGSPVQSAPADDGPEIYVSSQRQYFEMVRTALFAVERVVAQRLSNAGTPFDASGVIAELEKLNKEVEEKKNEVPDAKVAGEEAKKAAVPETSSEAGLGQPSIPASVLAQMSRTGAKLAAVSDRQVGRTVIKLHVLQPKLDKCVLRAKV